MIKVLVQHKLFSLEVHGTLRQKRLVPKLKMTMTTVRSHAGMNIWSSSARAQGAKHNARIPRIAAEKIRSVDVGCLVKTFL